MDKETRRLKRIKRRYRGELSFRILSVSAIVLAASFLVFFLTDIIRTGYTAFEQAVVQTEITYDADTVEIPQLAVSEEMGELVSRGYLRLIPMKVEEHPELMNTSHTEWVCRSGS